MSEPFQPHGSLVFYALAAIVIAAMIALGNRAYQKGYLVRWSIAWLLIGLVDALTYLLSVPGLAGRSSLLITAALGIGVGGICWSVLGGGFEMALRRPIPLRISRNILIAAGAGGLVVSLFLLLGDGAGWRPYAATDSLVTGMTALIAALLLTWERRRRLAPGFVVCSAALALFGVTSIFDAVHFATGSPASWIFPLVLFGMVIAGSSTVLFALEDDRQAALLAATQIEHIAYYDPLTGLPNRSLFLDRLIAVTSSSDGPDKAAVLFIDIDRLKEINDSFGHATGDAVIRSMAKRIRESVRSSDTAARFAGDEFIVLVEKLKNRSDVDRVAETLLSALGRPIISGGREIHASGSVGVAIYPDHGLTAEDLIRNADAAMYRAKREGRNRHAIFVTADHSPTRPHVDLVDLEEALRRAIDRKQLSVLYQPIIGLSDGVIRGVEALVRWEDDVLGSVSPAEFIPIAESSRLMGPLGELVFHQACRDAVRWSESGSERSIYVSINLSPEQFADPELIPRIRRAMGTARIEPGLLQFEVAEVAVMDDLGRSGRVFERLHELGVKLAIDDFGAGHSSLSSLALFPIETLKLDRSLMTEDESSRQSVIFSAAVAVAQRLGLMVIAEGIETTGQRDVAVREGCELGQGYLFGAPTLASAILELIAPATPAVEQREAEPDLDADITLVTKKTGPETRSVGSPPVAIVADDDPRLRNLMATLLRRMGPRVMVAEDGQKTIELLESLDPDQIQVVILDLMMPRMSGWEVLKRIAEVKPAISPRILLITAAGTEAIEKIDQSLYGAVIEKPFDQADFYDAVSRCSKGQDPSAGASDNRDGPWMVH